MICEELPCEFCGRCILAGPPCCSAKQAIFDARVLAEKQVEHARACQARADKSRVKTEAENERLRKTLADIAGLPLGGRSPHAKHLAEKALESNGTTDEEKHG